jgi:hypothetical protein
MLKVIECVESKYDVVPFEGYTFDQILQWLQKNEAQTLNDPITGERGIYIPTPHQQPGVKQVAKMVPQKDRNRLVIYGRD